MTNFADILESKIVVHLALAIAQLMFAFNAVVTRYAVHYINPFVFSVCEIHKYIC